MSITITDPVLIEQLTQLAANEAVELKDPSGRLIGRVVSDWPGKLPPGVKSPFTDEEMAERRKDRTGRPLADILRDLEGRG